MKKYVIRFIPLVFAIVLVIGLTLQKTEDNVQLSEKYRIKIGSFLIDKGVEIENSWWNTPSHFRKLAHTIEYFVFGIAIFIAIKRFWYCFFLSLLMSILDQIVKIYVPIRHFDITDIPFDVTGGICGIVVCWMVWMILRRKKED